MLIIGVDFDGTLAYHEYPRIGDEVPLAIETCKKLLECGHKLILYTMRSNKELDEAVEWCRERGIEFWGINTNPQQSSWTNSPKVYCHLYIDDAAFGVPLLFTSNSRPCVDWSNVINYITSITRK